MDLTLLPIRMVLWSIKISSFENGMWTKIKEYASGEERKFETGKLNAGTDYRYKVEALRMPTGESEGSGVKEIELHTSPCAEYATVWPTQELPVYRDSSGNVEEGKLDALQAVVVLEEENGKFLIQTSAGDEALKGYIDSDKCMINLPDYLGKLCRYDITNSYSSIYLAHQYAIPAVSGTVIAGYENVLLTDGTFLVPLLYPVAKKFAVAAEAAREEGYTIKIYDSFRPYVATRFIYDKTKAALDYVVPDGAYSRISLKDYRNGARANVLSLSNMKKAERVTEEPEEEKTEQKKKNSKKPEQKKTGQKKSKATAESN